MVSKIPVDTLHHTTVVTRNARETALQHSRFYGIQSWKVVNHAPDRLIRTSIHGRGRSANVKPEALGSGTAPGEFGFISAKGTSPTHGVTFEIIQPTGGLSTFEHFLFTRGQGVHSVCLSVVKPDEIGPLRQFLAENDIPLALSYALNEAADFLYFDTRKALGGFYLQVIVANRPDWESTIAPTETWNFEAEIPKDPGAKPSQRIRGVGHFGVVVYDVEAHLKNFAKLFGQPLWRAMNWKTSDWLLEETTTNGKPVIHGFFAARANVGKNELGVPVGFEVIQPLEGPSHYKEDFLQVLGPGIHHLDLDFPVETWDEWAHFNKWNAEGFSAPCCMSGWLRGRVHLYHYQDTRKNLGYVCEVHAPKPEQPPKAGSAPQATFWYDFSTRSNI